MRPTNKGWRNKLHIIFKKRKNFKKRKKQPKQYDRKENKNIEIYEEEILKQ